MTTIDEFLSEARTTAQVRRRPWRLMMGDAALSESSEVLDIGARVMVRTRYLGSWATGFQVAEVADGGYRLRRVSDGSLLPHEFEFADVHREVAGL